MPKVCIVIPLMNEEGGVDALMQRLTDMAEQSPYDFEYIVVDDGSSDATLDKALAWQDSHSELTIVKLSRNWGHQNAVNAGLDVALKSNPDAIVFMDGDLEDPPEMVPALLEQWEQGSQIVYSVKDKREDTWLRKFLFGMYYKIMRLFGEVKIESQAGLFSLLDKKAALHLQRFGERNKSYPNLRVFIGFRQARVNYNREKRFAGKPKQTLRKLMRDGLNALFAFSFAPLRIMSFLSMILTGIFLFLFLFVAFLRITEVEFWIFRQVPGWTSAILLVLLVSSFNLIFLAILGEYVARIFDEVRGRPYYIVEAVLRNKERVDLEG